MDGIVVKTKYNSLPAIDEPVRDGYIFTGWDKKVVAATAKTTYKATWKEAVFYDVTFNADGGTFSNDKEELVVKVAENTIPKVETPIKDGYVFIGWTPELSKVTGPTSYEAVWRKGTIEDYLTKKDGMFYFYYLKEVDDKLMLQGYQTINGINNTLDNDIKYMVVYKNLDNDDEIRLMATRIKDEKDIPKNVYSPDGHDYTYSWFNAEISLSKIPAGNYQMYIIAYNDKYYSKSLVSNKTYSNQITSYKDDNGSVIISNNYDSKVSFVELMVREQLMANKNGSYIYNQYDKYVTFEFTPTNKLHLRGNAYSFGMNLSSTSNVTRYLIFENKDNYEITKKSLGSITNGNYNVFLPVSDNLNKTRAWYDANIDLSDIDEGEYVIYISTASNITDINKMTEKIGRTLSDVKATINGKEYSFYINKDYGNRIEMKVKKITN